MQPVAQRDLARLRTRHLALGDDRRLLRRAPMAPSRRPRQHFHATETVPINWQITWHTIPLPRSEQAGSPHHRHPEQGGGQASLTVGLKQPQHAVDMDQVGAMLGQLAFEAVDKPGDLGSLRPKRGNNMRVCHPHMVGSRPADLNADVVELATQYRT